MVKVFNPANLSVLVDFQTITKKILYPGL